MYALSVNHLTKIYPGVTALKGIDLNVEEGDFFALLGQNGAGKSTTIGIVCSLINKSAGKVSVFGYDMDTYLTEAKSLLGVMPQEMNFSMFEKISQILINQAGYYGIPRRIALNRMEMYLQEMGLWHLRDQPAFRLSGGMKRRLMIARALMNQPRLLILDEPTAGVDIELRHLLWKFLTKLNDEGTTIILTTHYLEEAEQLCKNVAIIDHGEIIAHANMKSLINRVNIQTILLDIEKPIDSLNLNGYIASFVDKTTSEIVIDRNQSLNELFSLLNQKQIKVTSMRNKTNRLEELFMRLVSENNRGKYAE